MHRATVGSYGGGRLLASEVPPVRVCGGAGRGRWGVGPRGAVCGRDWWLE